MASSSQNRIHCKSYNVGKNHKFHKMKRKGRKNRRKERERREEKGEEGGERGGGRRKGRREEGGGVTYFSAHNFSTCGTRT